MKKIMFFFVLIVQMSLFAQIAVQPTGTGSEVDPYLITSLENLFWVSQNAGSWGSFFKQIADIDASETATWNPNGSGEYFGWSPIGTDSAQFTGRYNGNHYTISGLYINRPETDYVGLFGIARNVVAEDGWEMISKLGLIDVNITGRDYTGGLIGYIHGWYSGSSLWPVMHRGWMHRCYTTGTVNGRNYSGGLAGYVDKTYAQHSYSTCDVSGNWRVGGLCGAVLQYSNIYLCYSIGSVNGAQDVGGFTGFTDDYVVLKACYSTGFVHNGVYVGGFVGTGTAGTANQCYWDTETSGRNSSYLGSGKTTAQFKQNGFGSEWNFETDWWMEIGQTRPLLRSARKSRIFTPHHLQLMNVDLSDDYQLMCDLDLSCIQNPAEVWGTSENAEGGFVPCGNNANPFTGSLNGNGKIIFNLYINRSETDSQSLLGNCQGAEISNLNIMDSYVQGQTYTAGLGSQISDFSIITNCSYQGIVNSTWTHSGCLIGSLDNSLLENSFSAGEISGSSWIGGLVGISNNSAFITNCYSRSSVNGNGRIGGLIGGSYNDNVTNSFSTGFVNGSYSFGGFMGEKTSGVASSCFWDMQTSNQNSSAGGEGVQGKLTSEMKTQTTFTDASWDFTDIWEMHAGYNDGYPYLQWQYNAPAPPNSPENVQISITEATVTITWDEVIGATSYKVYSSDIPDGEFTEETEGAFDGLSWSAPASDSKKFYHVKAVKSSK